MPVTDLNHYFVRANDLEKTKAFYCDVLGFEVMPRPDFPFPGYWLGANGKIQVHIGPHGIPNAELYYIGTSAKSATDNTGVVDHIAFLATEPEGPPSDAVVGDLYRVCDALFLPSRDEGFGLPVLEAAASRLPVVCADLPSVRAIARASETFSPDKG